MLSYLLTGRARLLTHMSGWALVFFTFYILISWIRPFPEALSRAVLNVSFMMALFYGNGRILVNRYLEQGRYASGLLLTALFWLGMAALRVWTELHLLGGSLFADRLPGASDARRLFVAYAISYFLLLLFSTLYQFLENRQMLELKHQRLEAQHAEAQLNYLKAQINPHFLFNTLNNIYAAAVLQHPRTADMVLQLSELLRYVTYDGQARRVPLEKELAQIRAYLHLFQLKSEKTLAIQWEIRGETAGIHIEPMLLLPLAENALKHGDLEDNPDGYLRLRLTIEENSFTFDVENTFNPENRQKDAQGGVGLENVRRRLALLENGENQLDTGQQNGVFRATLRLHFA